MGLSERLQLNLLDTYYGYQAPAQAGRTQNYPGKAVSNPSDFLWQDFKVPQGNAALEANGPVTMQRVRVEKLHRNIICDDTIAAPVTDTPVVTTITNAAAWGATTPTSTLTPTDTQDVNGEQERTSGYDWPVGAAP